MALTHSIIYSFDLNALISSKDAFYATHIRSCTQPFHTDVVIDIDIDIDIDTVSQTCSSLVMVSLMRSISMK